MRARVGKVDVLSWNKSNASYRAAAAAAGSRHHLGSRSQTGYIAKALEEVKICGKRFSAYPATGREAPDAEKSLLLYYPPPPSDIDMTCKPISLLHT